MPQQKYKRTNKETRQIDQLKPAHTFESELETMHSNFSLSKFNPVSWVARIIFELGKRSTELSVL